MVLNKLFPAYFFSSGNFFYKFFYELKISSLKNREGIIAQDTDLRKMKGMRNMRKRECWF